MTTLATRDPESCPDCGAPLLISTWKQDALFRHGGYGGTESTTRRYCPCGWTLTSEVGTERPPSRVPGQESLL